MEAGWRIQQCRVEEQRWSRCKDELNLVELVLLRFSKLAKRHHNKSDIVSCDSNCIHHCRFKSWFVRLTYHVTDRVLSTDLGETLSGATGYTPTNY
eukprot:766167-Hanusia_phi.AAC.4